MSKTIAVVHGGTSHERDKSILYGKTISKVFRDAGNNVVEIHLHPNGSWTKDGSLQSLENAINGIPLLWNALVGEDGEKGLVEKLCAKCKVKVLGHSQVHTDISGSKKTLKEVLKQHKIKTPYHKTLHRDNLSNENLKHAYQMVGIPMIVKPVSGSGNKNIFFANNFPEYKQAVDSLLSNGYDVLVEKPISGKHVSCFVFFHNNLLHAHVYSEENLNKDS
jgi:D-alanine-D-alanine ligase